MKKFVGYFIKYPIVSNLLIVSILVFGFLSMRMVRSTLIPRIDSNVILISINYPGASPEEVENGVVMKIENQIQGLSGIDKYTSISSENTASITIETKMEANIDVVLQEVKNAVDGVSSFPTGMEPPVVEKKLYAQKAINYAISGDVSLVELKKHAQRIEDGLRREANVTEIEIRGYPEEEIQVSLNEEAMRRYQFTFDEIAKAIEDNNLDLTGGTLKGADEELMIRTRQKGYYAEDLRNIVLRSNNEGAVVRLQDVANVTDRWEEDPDRFYVNGEPAIEIQVNFSEIEDIIVVADDTKAFFERFNDKDYPAKATELRDRSRDIVIMKRVLVESGIVGIILVLVILSLFLNPRLSFWVAFAIPICFMGMFIVAAMADITMNKMSLFGLIIVIGILVDDGVVICEAIYQEYEKGKSRFEATVDGVRKVFPSVFSGVLTTIVAFSTFFFLKGKFGEMFFELGIVVVATLAFSLLEGVTTLPAHVANSKALKVKREEKKVSIGERFLLKIRDRYFMPVLSKSLRYGWLTLIIPIAIVIITKGAVDGNIIKIGDASVEDYSEVVVELKMPSGTPESTTVDVLNYIEDMALKTVSQFDEDYQASESYMTFITQSISAADEGQVVVNLVSTDQREFSSEDFANIMMQHVGPLPEAERLEFVQESNFGKPISMYLVGQELVELKQAKDWLKSELLKLKGLKNVQDDDVTGMREVEITLKDQAHLMGLNLNDVVRQVRQGYFGEEAQKLTRGKDEVKIYVRYESAERRNVGQLENMMIRLDDGREIPLKEVANLGYTRSVISINHLNGNRQITLEADLANSEVSLAEVRAEIDNVILKEFGSRYPDISIEYGGRNEKMKDTYASMGDVVPIITFIILAIIIFTFRSLSQTFLIFVLIPLSMVGALWGHWVHDYGVDLPSMLGMVALIGVLINDSIVLIEAYNQNLRERAGMMMALMRAIKSRFRPIMLTTLTTCAGLLPMILSNDPDTQFVVPMGISLFYGLLTATVLTLLILPSMIVAVNSFKRFLKWAWEGKMVSKESVEHACKEAQVDLEAGKAI
ncbi:efflux RND transporter permease subunit [Aureibacter tunicatorum]|uniref:Multidrug efflux pump subunit AcrB n=1 Tax=Aureibacter tunicatorum TaxID=866807 RepID=A0AAE3XN70_9BACT|nr:efflux RND transporter permease subunit [Aureibacter tunicatorum]MDR6239673.1 multidrug efflux pump subunit AcrB [Aureibacter tunicatorum]BDD04149.1 acriflavin resistance protein [Aureibacter tunicatorum]